MKRRLPIPDPGVTPPPYCPACLNHWYGTSPEASAMRLHDSCREALRALARRAA